MLHFVLHIFKMGIDSFGLSGLFQVNYISINGFHNVVRPPSSSCHDVLIGDPYGVHNRRCIMPQVMKTEMGELGKSHRALKAVCDLIRVRLMILPSIPLILEITKSGYEILR